MGVSVRETNAEISTAAEITIPNSLNSLPTKPCIKITGRNTEASVMDVERTAKIISALEHGFTVDELKRAVDGAKSSPFHRGQNDRGVIYDSIDLIFRNPEKIETFICILGTQASPKNKNVSTGLKLGFVERQKSQVNMLRKMGDKYFPHLSDNPKVENNVTNLLTSRQENKVNEQK